MFTFKYIYFIFCTKSREIKKNGSVDLQSKKKFL